MVLLSNEWAGWQASVQPDALRIIAHLAQHTKGARVRGLKHQGGVTQ
jgi:hypothetical protein